MRSPDPAWKGSIRWHQLAFKNQCGVFVDLMYAKALRRRIYAALQRVIPWDDIAPKLPGLDPTLIEPSCHLEALQMGP